MLSAIGVLGIQPCTHPLPRRRDVPAYPVGRRRGGGPDPHVPPLVEPATGTPRNADTSCTVHRRSATTACGLPLCVTVLTDFSRLGPPHWGIDLDFLTSHQRHLLRSHPVSDKPALHDRSRGEVGSGHRLGRRGLGVDVSAPLFAAVVTSADSADLHGPVNLAEGHSARDRPSATVPPVEVTPGGSDLSGRGRSTLTACRTPTRFSQSRGPHTPCTVGSSSGRPDRVSGMYPFGCV